MIEGMDVTHLSREKSIHVVRSIHTVTQLLNTLEEDLCKEYTRPTFGRSVERQSFGRCRMVKFLGRLSKLEKLIGDGARSLQELDLLHEHKLRRDSVFRNVDETQNQGLIEGSKVDSFEMFGIFQVREEGISSEGVEKMVIGLGTMEEIWTVRIYV
jgi:hypothetical protein